MWITDNNKEQVRINIRSDIESNITNISDICNQVQEIIAVLNRTVSGSYTGKDQLMFDSCQRALQELLTVLQNLYQCRNYIDNLDTTEWVDDE